MGYSYEYIDELIYEYVSYLEYYNLLDFLEAKDKKGLFRDRHKIIRHKIQRTPYCGRLPIGMHKWRENVKIFDDIEENEEE